VASFTGDGAYDRDNVYAEVAARHPAATVIVPPRATLMVWTPPDGIDVPRWWC
jgi:hypothetical protein